MFKYILLFLSVMTLSCSLDYYELDTDELEILYNKEGKLEVLPILCEKYYKKYQNELIEKDYIVNKTDLYRKKTIEYCNLSFNKLKNKFSAKILEELYFSDYVNNKKNFLYFIYWAYKNGDEDSIETFIKKDAVLFAVLFHSDKLMDYLVKDIKYLPDNEVIKRFETANKLIEKYLKDIENIKNSWLFYTEKDYIRRSFKELSLGFTDLIQNMRNNRFLIKEIRENLSVYEKRYSSNRKAKKYIELFYTLRTLMRINLDNFYMYTIKKEGISKNVAKAMNIDEKDLDKFKEILFIIREFINEKEKYTKKYDQILQKEI
ncbi:hypothetical protein [Persephonella sp.]